MGRTARDWRSRRAAFAPALLLTVALTAACGSTVQQGAPGQPGQDVAAPGEAGDVAISDDDFGLAPADAGDDGAFGLEGGAVDDLGEPVEVAGAEDTTGGGATASGGQGPAGGAAAAPGSGQPGAAGSGATGGGQTSGGQTSGGQGGAMPPKGRGYNEKTVYIGYATTEDAREAGKGIGVDVYTGDGKRQAQAVVKDINRRGGLLGRKIELIYHDVSSKDYQSNRPAAQEAACRTWTEDHTVYAAVSGTGNLQYGDSPIYACLAKKDTALFFSDNAPHESTLYAQYPSHVFTPGVASVGRFGPALVRALVDHKYFSKWDTRAGAPGSMPVKVGVLYPSDLPSIPQVYGPALRAAGYPKPVYFEVSSKSTQAVASDTAAAVLRFRSEGVTHVLTNSTLPFFGPAADNQNYRPRYGVTTWDALAVSAQLVPARALNGALGAGYVPHVDVDQGNAPKDEKNNPVIARCLKVMEKAGMTATNRFTVYSMLTKCETFWLLEKAVKKAGRFDTATMRAAIDTFRKPVIAGVTFVAQYGPPAQHDGAAAVRTVAYRGGRGFVLVGGNRLIR